MPKYSQDTIVPSTSLNAVSQRSVTIPVRNDAGVLVYSDDYIVPPVMTTAEIAAIAAAMAGRAKPATLAVPEYALIMNSTTGVLNQISPNGTITVFAVGGGMSYYGGFTVTTRGTQTFAPATPVAKVALAGGAWSASPLVGFTLSNGNTTLTSATGGATTQSLGFNVTFSSDTNAITVQYIIYRNGVALAGANAITASAAAGVVNVPYSLSASKNIPVANGDTFEIWTLVTNNVGAAVITTTSATLTIGAA